MMTVSGETPDLLQNKTDVLACQVLTIFDAEIAFDGINLDKISCAFNAPNPHVLIAMYLCFSP